MRRCGRRKDSLTALGAPDGGVQVRAHARHTFLLLPGTRWLKPMMNGAARKRPHAASGSRQPPCATGSGAARLRSSRTAISGGWCGYPAPYRARSPHRCRVRTRNPYRGTGPEPIPSAVADLISELRDRIAELQVEKAALRQEMAQEHVAAAQERAAAREAPRLRSQHLRLSSKNFAASVKR